MSCVGNLLDIVMDDITDAEMLLDYADESENDTYTNFFMDKARKRIQNIEEDYAFTVRMIGLNDKINSGDEIAEALNGHIKSQIEMLKKRL